MSRPVAFRLTPKEAELIADALDDAVCECMREMDAWEKRDEERARHLRTLKEDYEALREAFGKTLAQGGLRCSTCRHFDGDVCRCRQSPAFDCDITVTELGPDGFFCAMHETIEKEEA